MIYVNGIKSAHSNRNTPRTVIEKAFCLKIRKSGVVVAFLAGGRRDRIRRLAKMQLKRIIKPMIRQLHGNPTSGISFWSARGNMIPPNAPPDAAIPVAFPLFCLK